MIEFIVSLILPKEVTSAAIAFFFGLASMLGLYLKARHDGVKAERADRLRSEAQSVAEADEIERAVAGQETDAKLKEARKWLRK